MPVEQMSDIPTEELATPTSAEDASSTHSSDQTLSPPPPLDREGGSGGSVDGATPEPNDESSDRKNSTTNTSEAAPADVAALSRGDQSAQGQGLLQATADYERDAFMSWREIRQGICIDRIDSERTRLTKSMVSMIVSLSTPLSLRCVVPNYLATSVTPQRAVHTPTFIQLPCISL